VRGSAGNGHMRSPSPLSAHRRQQNHPPEPRPQEQPPVVSGIGCRSGEGEGTASLSVSRAPSAMADRAAMSPRTASAWPFSQP
jgi:hypothetical protein